MISKDDSRKRKEEKRTFCGGEETRNGEREKEDSSLTRTRFFLLLYLFLSFKIAKADVFLKQIIDSSQQILCPK